MTSQYKVVKVVVDTRNITLYYLDGSSTTIPQGDSRIAFIRDVVIPAIEQHDVYEGPLVYHSPEDNPYAEYEKQSKVVRMFSIAKRKLARFFGSGSEEEPKENLEPMTVGEVAEPSPVFTADLQEAKAEENKAELEEIMRDAIPVSSPHFAESKVPRTHDTLNPTTSDEMEKEEDTVVAVVGGKVIPGVENLVNYFRTANMSGGTEAIDNFMTRVATVDRQHSVKELLEFLRYGDFPLAKDGRIIAYKALTHSSDGTCFVDCHSQLVKQQVGSKVVMDASLVDHNRHRDCSNGLHIARRDYLSGFGGDVLVLVYVAPEDVISVPYKDRSKMRACGYEIIAEITGDARTAALNGKSIVSFKDAAALMKKAINNEFPAPFEEVRLLDKSAHKLQITPLGEKPVPVPETTTEESAETPEHLVTNDDHKAVERKKISLRVTEYDRPSEPEMPKAEESKQEAVEQLATTINQVAETKLSEKAPKASSKSTKTKGKAKAKVSGKSPAKETPRSKLAAIYSGKTPTSLTQAEIEQMKAIKKAAKKSWTAMGVPEEFHAVLTA